MSRVLTAPACRGMNLLINSGTALGSCSPVLCATPQIRRGGPVLPFASNAKPVTTADWAIDSASTSSLSGSDSIMRRMSLSRISSGRRLASCLSEERSASANTTSKAMTATPASVSLSTSSATTVRGHGHWPYSASAASSISMMRTGMSGSGSRGLTLW